MLTLSRKINETIQIGDNIVLIVKRIDGDNVRIGIEAPKTIPIYRRRRPQGRRGSQDRVGDEKV